MKVRIHGFELVLGTEISLEELMNEIRGRSGERMDEHILALSQKSGYWVGVLLTIKDATRFVLLKQFKVTAQELEAGTSMADVNFFLIHPETGRGLYQYYFHSASVNTFCNLCKRRHLNLKRAMGVKTRAEKLTYAILEKPEDIVESAQRLKAIKNIEFEQVSYTFYEKNFNPIARFANRIVERAVFTLPTNQERVKPAVVNFLKKVGLKKAKLVGIDPSDREIILKLANDHAVFEEYDFDDFVGTIDLDASDFEKTINQSKNINQLITIANRPDVKLLLEAPVQN